MTIDNLRKEAKDKIQDRYSKTCVFVGSSQNDDIIKKVQTKLQEAAPDVAVLPVGSFGLDGIEPFMVVAKPNMPRIVYGGLTAQSAEAVLTDCVLGDGLKAELAVGRIGAGKPSEVPDFFELPFFQSQQRIALRNCGMIDPEDIDDYTARGGYDELAKAISNPAQELIQEIGSSGLKDIGSGSQTIGARWQQYHDVTDDQKYVVCNAAKRDIEDNSVRLLLEGDPHTVLEGLMLAGYAVGANKGYVVVNQGNELAVRRVETAIRQMTDKGLLGDDILGTGWHFVVEISICSDSIVNREDTAIVSGLSGEREMPFVRNEADGVLRLQGKPVCIHSAEVLAKLPVILQKGSSWFKQIGTAQSSGTRIVSLHGDVVNCGVAELPFDITLQDVVYRVGGGVANEKEFKAVLVGGITGGFLSEKDLGLNLSFEDMRSSGIRNESGDIRVLNNERCMVQETKGVMLSARNESCGKCVMCREGTYQLERILSDMTEGEAKADDMLLIEEICNGMKLVSICDYGHEAPNAVMTALLNFKEEFDAHVSKKLCPALVCKKYITYHILGEKCTGCGRCAAICPADAILGEEGIIHIVDQHDCIKCGKCIEVCPEEYSAVVKAGLIKPRTPRELIPVGSWRRR